jgi:hypothetical protein
MFKLVCWVLICGTLAAQTQPMAEQTPLGDTPSSPQTNPQAAAPAASTGTPANVSTHPDRDVSVQPKKFARNFFSDQKMIWTFPTTVTTRKRLIPTATILGATAAMAAWLDPVEGRYFRQHDVFKGLNDVMSEHRTTAASLLIPASFYGAGLIKKDKYLAHTGLLAAEAWVNVDILGEVMRNATRRKRPLDIAPDGNFSATWYKAGGNPLKTSGSFPSGHTAWSFAVATVVARRYGSKHKWVPVVAYGLASLDALTRIASSNHFASDAVFGAVIGYSTTRFVVLRH